MRITEVKHLVGLEAEVFVKDENGLVIPKLSGYFPTDSVPCLAEIRGKPGKNPAETAGNFMQAYYDLITRASRTNMTLHIVPEVLLSVKEVSETFSAITEKEASKCSNIYGDDINSLSSAVYKRGRYVGQNITAGLHIHFSSERIIRGEDYEYTYSKEKKESKASGKELFSRQKLPESSLVSFNAIFLPTIKEIVLKLDENLFPKYVTQTSKYRRKGFFERKPYGFEYRSLPMSAEVFNDIFNISTYAHQILLEAFS